MSSEETQTNSGYTREQKIILVASLGGIFLALSCLSLPAPFLPKLDERHNIGSDLTGWILGLLPLLSLMINPIVGKLMSYISPEFMYVYGLFVTGFSTIFFGLLEHVPLPPPSETQVDATYLAVAMATRTGQSIGASAVITAALALLSTKFATNKITILSYSETAIGLGVMAGPALGSGFYKLGGFQLIFYGVGGLVLLLFLIAWCIIPHKMRVEGGGEGDAKSSCKPILTNGNILLAFLLTAMSGAFWTSIDPILEPELRNKFHLSEELCSLCFLLMSAAYMLMTPVMGRMVDNMKSLDPHLLLIIGFSVASVAFVLMGPSPLFHLHRPLWLLLLSLFVLGIAEAFIIVPCISLLSVDEKDPLNPDQDLMNDATKALIMGVWNSSYCVGAFFGPTFSGIATRHGTFGWTMTYYSIGCMAMAAVIVVIKCVRSCKRRCGSQQSQGETTPLLANQA